MALGDASGEVSLLGLLNVFLRRRRMLLVIPIIVTALVIGHELVFPRYLSKSMLMPNVESADITKLAGIAAQFGINVGGATSGSSIDFYADLLTSRQTLAATLSTNYSFTTSVDGTDTTSGTLLDLLDISGHSPQERLNRGVDKLNDRISLDKDENAGVLTIQVTMPWPLLAEQVNRRLLTLANQFNKGQLQSQAHAERVFLEGRLLQAQGELDSAEARMRDFLEQNRTYLNSPRLKFEADRIQRRIDQAQGVYTSVAQSYEQSRFDEVRNTPVFTIIDAPEGSGARPHTWTLLVVIGLILGLIVAVITAFAWEYLSREQRQSGAEQQEFGRLWKETVTALSPRRLLRAVWVRERAR